MSSVKIEKLNMELFSNKKSKNFLLDHLIELLLLALVIGITLIEPKFMQTSNILNILRSSAMKGVIAYGMCIVIISGEIDLSVGSQVALSGVIIAWTSKYLSSSFGLSPNIGVVIGIVGAIIFAIAVGYFHAWARDKFNMPTFIITLATLNVMYGIAAMICDGFPISGAFTEWFVFAGSGKILGIPVPALVFILIFFAFWFLTEKTTLGRNIYAVGGNAEAARLNGISVWKTRVFVLCAVQIMCVIAGIMNSAQVQSAAFTFGRGWETQIISSVVIGGTSMLGGIGTIWGTLIGVLFTGVIANAMTLLNVNEYMQYIVNGGLMFFAVMFNTYMTKKKNSN